MLKDLIIEKFKLKDKLPKNFAQLKQKLFTSFSKSSISEKEISDAHIPPHLTELEKYLKFNRLSDFLPYEYYDDKWEIYHTSRSYGFLLAINTLLDCDESIPDILTGIFSVGFPDDTCIQFSLHGSSELNDVLKNWQNARLDNSLYKTIVKERINFYKSGAKKKLFAKNKMIIRNINLYVSITFPESYDDSKISTIDNLRSTFTSTLKSIGIDCRNVSPNEFINLIREILCCSTDDLEQLEYDEQVPIKDQITTPNNLIYIDKDGLVVNKTAVRSLAIRRYPEQNRLFQMNDLIGDRFLSTLQMTAPFLISCNIQLLNKEETNSWALVESERTFKQEKNGIGRVLPDVGKRANEWRLIKNLISEGIGFVQLSHYIHLFTPLNQSEEIIQDVKSLFRSKGWELVVNSNIQWPTLLSSLPLYFDPQNSKEQKDHRLSRVQPQYVAINSLPILSDWTGTGTPTIMLLGRRGQIQFVDLFDNQAGNYNGAIVATSGSGKSFFLNELATSYLSTGAKVWIIDVGKSYKNTCDLLGGQFIEFAKSSKICLNPFGFVDTADEADNQDVIEMLKSIVMVAAGRDLKNQLEMSYVERSILEAIAEKGQKATFTTICKYLYKLNNNSANDIAQSLYSYTNEGIYGEYFEGEANINFRSNLIVLELEELKSKGNLVFIVLLIIMLKITQEMYLGARNQKKVCIIDEAWDLMGSGDSGSFIKTGYRRARKYGGAFLTATQGVDDYFMNETTKACWANADWKFLLRQGAEPKQYKFDPNDWQLLRSVTTEAGIYSEIMIQCGGKTAGVSRLIVDGFSNFIYSSKAQDIELVNYVKNNEFITDDKGNKKPINVEGAVRQIIQWIVLMGNNFPKYSQSHITNFIYKNIQEKGYQSVKKYMENLSEKQAKQ